MEVILLRDINKLGDKDEIVRVKDGFARNYLIPKGYARVATASAKKMIEENIKQAAHRQEHRRQEAEQKAEQMKDLKLTIETLAGADGKLFGSITPLMVANQLKEKGFEVDRRKVTFEEDIKHTGTFKIYVSLHKEVKVEIDVEVVAKEK